MNMISVVVVAAQPDDDVLGCGGTIACDANAGDQLQGLIVAEGAFSRQQKLNRPLATQELSALARTAQQAWAILLASSI